MFNSFVDGTKSGIEMTAVCNATGLVPQSEGLSFPPATRFELAEVLQAEERGRHAGEGGRHRSHVLGLSRRPGRSASPRARHLRGDRGRDRLRAALLLRIRACCRTRAARYAALYRPIHMIGLELGISVASAALRKEPTGAPTGFRSDVAATAKRDLKAGEMLDGEGGFCVWGKQTPAELLACRRASCRWVLPTNVQLKRDVREGEAAEVVGCRNTIRTTTAVRVRREMEAGVRKAQRAGLLASPRHPEVLGRRPGFEGCTAPLFRRKLAVDSFEARPAGEHLRVTAMQVRVSAPRAEWRWRDFSGLLIFPPTKPGTKNIGGSLCSTVPRHRSAPASTCTTPTRSSSGCSAPTARQAGRRPGCRSAGRRAGRTASRWPAWRTQAGIDFMLPIGRWKGYGGETDMHGESLETVTWATGLLAHTERITVFGTVHAPLFHPIIAAKQMRHRRPCRRGPLRPQHRGRLERGRVRDVRRRAARARRALRLCPGLDRRD